MAWTDWEEPDQQAVAAPQDNWVDWQPPEQQPQAQPQQSQGNWVDWQPEPQQPEAEGTIGTALRSAAHAILPSAAGLAGIPAGIAGGAALGLPAGGWGAIPGGIVGGIAGYIAGSKAQEFALQAMGFDDSQQQAVNARVNPKSALAGEIAGALPTVGVGAGAQIATRVGGALGGGLLEAGSQALSDEPWDPTRIGGAAIAGGLLTKPTRLGEAIGGGAAKVIGRPELWHGAAGPDAAAGTAKEQPPPRTTPEAGAELPTDYYAKPPRVTETEAPPAAPGERPPQVFEGEAPAARAAEPAPQVTPVDPAIDAAINRRPIEPRVTEEEPPTKYGQMLDQEFPRVPQPQVIEGEAPAAAARGPEPRVTPAEEPVMENLARTPREAMEQKAPDETYGQVLRRLASDERGGGRLPPRRPTVEEPGAGPVAKAADEAKQQWHIIDNEGKLVGTAPTRGGAMAEMGALKKKSDQKIGWQVVEQSQIAKAPAAAAAAEAMPTPRVMEGEAVPGAATKVDESLKARGFTPEQIAKLKPKAKEAILRLREGEIGAGPPPTAREQAEAIVRGPAPGEAAEALDLKLANRMLNQPAILKSEAAKRGITPEALKAQATEVLKTPALPGTPAPLSPVGGAPVAAAAPPAKPPKPPTVGQAAAAAGGTPPPAGPTSMVYVPPSKRSDLSELVRNMKLLVGGDIGPLGRQAETSIRKSYGNLNREYEQGQALLDRHRETIANTSEADRWKLINRIEGGNQYAGWQPTPEQRTLINDHKSVMDAWKSQLQGLDRTAQLKFVDDYLVHMYDNPDQAKQFFNNWGKRGGAGSTKKRTMPTYQDAIDAGLKPLTSDPIELAQRYGLSMKHFIASNDVIERAVNTGVAGYFKAGKSIGASGSPSPLQVGGPPPGWERLNAPPNAKGHELYAPEDFAAKYNKFYERGYFGGAHAPIYNAIRQSNSAWTQLELGLNAYHFFTMANEAVISDVARGFDKIFSGQFKKGLQDIAQSPLAPRTRYVEGKRFQQEYLNPNSTNPVASVIAEANARPIGKGHALDVLGTPGDPTVPVRGAFIKNFSPENINFEFRKAWNEVKQDWGASQGLGEVVKFPFKQASRAIQTVSAPLFDKYIPALKAGAVHSQMEAWFEANPHIDPHNMTPEQRSSAVAAATKIVDSTDNRFGEMIHDNLFMNKTLQQSAIVGMRSFSWTLGAMREIAGGAAAGGKAFSALGRGENKFSMAHPEYDPRIAYTLALPFVVATTSAIYQFLKTGEAPEDVRDLYAPKTGGTIPGLGGKGEVKEHVLMPGFHKDVYGWLAHPLREAYAKSSGAVSTAYEQLTNEDWRGDPIYKRGADPLEHMQQRASHLFGRMGPISVRSMIKGQPETSGISPIETSLGFRAPGADIQDPKQLENWMRVKTEREWQAKERHARTEAKKYEPRVAAGGQ